MSDFLTIFSSNRVEILCEKWKESLFQVSSDPFAKRFVIVPSPAMKSYLQLSLAKDPKCKIATGLTIATIDNSVFTISRHLFPEYFSSGHSFSPSPMELSWIIESTIRKLMTTKHSWSKEETNFWQPLVSYITPSGDLFGRFEKRLTLLSSLLADLFALYGRYGCAMLKGLEMGHFDNWQQQLWKLVKQDYPTLHFPYQQLDGVSSDMISVSSCKNVSIHLFALSFLPERVHAFFKKIATKIPVNYYLLSPCQLFWGDICSDREKKKLETFWINKGASKNEIEQLELYLSNRNLLLANFGRMGREMARQIEESAANVSDCYVLPSSVVSQPKYQELLSPEIFLDSTKGNLTLLEAVQSDMALLYNQQPNQTIDFTKSDSSIQLHIAPTKQREIEILYNNLLDIITKHADSENPIFPGDVVVMAPDLCEYEAAIKTVFDAEDSLIKCQLSDVQIALNVSLVRGFLNLLKLATNRWEKEDVLILLECAEFQKKAELSSAEVLEIREWAEASGVFWGKDVNHRKQAFLNDYEKDGLSDEYTSGTWDQSSNRLVMGFAVDPEQINPEEFPFDLPSRIFESSSSALFEKWITVLYELKKQLTPICSSTMSLKEWSDYFFSLKKNFFKSIVGDKNSADAEIFLETQIRSISSSEDTLKLETFSFESVYAQFEKKLSEEKSSFFEGELQSVRFCSLLSMRALPAKIVVLIGLSEGSFPRQDIPSSLNSMRNSIECDYVPSQVDFDRYLFLEALLSARSYFILSYSAFSSEEQRPVQASLLVQELFNYLDDGYTIEGKSISEQCTINHPFDSFHKSYFSDKGFRSYSKKHYAMAKAFYRSDKQEPYQLIKEFEMQSSSLCNEEEIFVDLKDLSAFASNPLKIFLNKKHNIYVDKQTEESKEPFELIALDKYQFRRESVKMPFSSVVEKAIKIGKMPTAKLFKAIAFDALEVDVGTMHNNFKMAGVDPKAIFPVVFSQQYEEVSFSEEKGWMLPALKFTLDSGAKIVLVGSIKEVSSKGIIFHQDRNIKGVARIWPEFLALYTAIEKYNLPIDPQMISSKNHKVITAPSSDFENKLKMFIEYYFLGLNNLSPLIPEWIESILKNDEVSFGRCLQNDIQGEFSSFYNNYALWLFKGAEKLPNDSVIHPLWRKFAIDIYGDLAAHLKSRR